MLLEHTHANRDFAGRIINALFRVGIWAAGKNIAIWVNVLVEGDRIRRAAKLSCSTRIYSKVVLFEPEGLALIVVNLPL